MNVLVVGSGGREHSIIQKLAKSKQVTKLYAAPGNGGIEDVATCVDIKDNALEELVAFAKEAEIDWTIVGPEVPLTAGIVNVFKAAGLTIFGPTKEAAIIEGSKDFAKAFMKKYNVPTAEYQTFTDVNEAKAYIHEKGAPIVIKADGLAAGKGVVVALTIEQALEAVEMMLVDNQFGEAGSRVVIEEFLDGKEFSLMAFVNGENVYPMIPARDHKRAFDNDQGPNTGGMGAYAPVPDLAQENVDYAINHILKPTAKGMVEEGRSFTGILYAGLIETTDGPKVIEFNARLGDPETQVVLPLLDNDLLQVVQDVTAGNNPQLKWSTNYCIGTVVASAGYPGTYNKGVALPALPPSEDCFVIHAGTKKVGEDSYQATGGRVLLIGSVKPDQKQAQQAVYHYLNVFDGNDSFFYRTDIGFK
ncbi:phosphoribosylamine--glycine ligase [Aquibacillus salsiterrae]|uniref:Phosphoribosylamine--glycine ligase n=1 Tax=Aquibacillus salsiterrae TaxID=2950439 RepID=A0A9X3WEE5_9BACI|nr:phosphoribosylamine--glycine ligase [Aquibacillus salsiterrae]MDC3417493.1 phosphoribosylamine--glycine ligase [Aquibacillus salsiterrae]